MSNEAEEKRPEARDEPRYDQRLVRLWREREKTLTQASMLDVEPKLKEHLKMMADAYGQCAEELENPPERLFCALGYNEPNAQDEARHE